MIKSSLHTGPRERPILFKADMVRAILDRGKSQTRRLLKPQPEQRTITPPPPQSAWTWTDRNAVSYLVGPERSRLLHTLNAVKGIGPLGDSGDRLWVRENWQLDEATGEFLYQADHAEPRARKWRPSIFMPRQACRLELEITATRFESVQDLTGDDAIAEGAYRVSRVQGWTCDGSHHFPTPVTAYRHLWNRINPAHLWESNPFVAVITFKRLGGH